jgi:AcrR family transcriptional regulator
MNRPTKRSYLSPTRAQQADETRVRITEAAHELLVTKGFAPMTVDAVAREAGVSTQSVYSNFGSKAGLVEAVIERAAFGQNYRRLVEEATHAEDPVLRLRCAASIARQIYDAERSVIDVMGGASVVSPDLAAKMQTKELRRRSSQAQSITLLSESGLLKDGLDDETASDILWTLTGRDIYRMLVQVRGWSADKYQNWLADTLVNALLA